MALVPGIFPHLRHAAQLGRWFHPRKRLVCMDETATLPQKARLMRIKDSSNNFNSCWFLAF